MPANRDSTRTIKKSINTFHKKGNKMNPVFQPYTFNNGATVPNRLAVAAADRRLIGAGFHVVRLELSPVT